jgi:hypothetical protein
MWEAGRRECDQGYADDDEDRHARQLATGNYIQQRLRAHNGGMGEARPRRSVVADGPCFF